MSILNVNTIQPVGSGQTITVSAADISAPSTVVTASSFVGGVTVTSGNLTGITSVSTTNLTVNGNAYPSAGSLSNRNKIINGDMRIDQRNSGSTVTVNSTSQAFSVDRWFARGISSAGVFTLQQSSTAPEGFTNSIVATVTTTDASLAASDRYFLCQRIEANNVGDYNFGTASARTVTLSFWVRSSVTGTFGGSLMNVDQNRSYPFAYSITSSNTWEYKTVTIVGDTTGTWNITGNAAGITLNLALSSGTDYIGTANAWAAANYITATGQTNLMGTNGATFYLTGVQLEVGTVATPFEHRSYGDELLRCQRYYFRFNNMTDGDDYGSGFNTGTSECRPTCVFPVTMRTAPSSVEQTGTAGDYMIAQGGSEITCTSVPTFSASSPHNARVVFTASGSLTTGQGSAGRAKGSNSFLAFSAEL